MSLEDLLADLDNAVNRAWQTYVRADATDTIPCDGCGTETPDPTPCDHHRELCEDCIAESKCRECRQAAADECGAW